MPRRPDAIVIGGGLVGLAVTAAAAERGLRVVLAYDHRPGESSPAGAGMLAPSVERELAPARMLGEAARDGYPAYVEWLHARTGIEVPLNRRGILELALTEAELEAGPFRSPPPGTQRLDAGALAALEPALAHAAGALLHPSDGAVNNLVLLRALKHVVARQSRVRVVEATVVRVEAGTTGATVSTRAGERLVAGAAVVAAGAWAPQLPGLPRAIPVEPVRGQMLSIAAEPLRHVVWGPGGYVVPRGDGRTLAGSTMERVGFDPTTTQDALARVRAAAERLCPAFVGTRALNGWAGLRPVTPDFLPIIGRDPQQTALVYACGHSRNGILLAPLTGELVADLLAEAPPRVDLAPLGIQRFASAR